jgi:hypothetical protein
MEFKGTLDPTEYIIGWIFKGKYFKHEDDMRGMTINSDTGKPKPVYAPEYVEAMAMIYKKKSDRLLDIQRLLLEPLEDDV